jgi:hypothetical protein
MEHWDKSNQIKFKKITDCSVLGLRGHSPSEEYRIIFYLNNETKRDVNYKVYLSRENFK